MTHASRRGPAPIALLGAAALLLTGCAGGASEPSTSPSPSTTSARADDSVLVVTGAWAKAAAAGENSAVFANIASRGGTPLDLTGAETDVAASAQLHTTAATGDGSMDMAQVAKLRVPASSHLELAPGGDHIMLMDLTRALEPGEKIDVTLLVSDGSRTTVTATVKDYSGAKESYVPTPTEAPSP